MKNLSERHPQKRVFITGIAGVSGPFEEHGTGEWKRTTDINYWSLIYVCQTFVPLLKQQGSGHIINTASAAGILAAGEMGAYNATKAVLKGMIKRRLYIFTRYDGYLMWLFKRLIPQGCSSLIGWVASRQLWIFR